jgi:hypothetical protein
VPNIPCLNEPTLIVKPQNVMQSFNLISKVSYKQTSSYNCNTHPAAVVKRWSHAQLLYMFPYKCNRTDTGEIYSGYSCLWAASLCWVKPIKFLFNITVLYFVVVQLGVALDEWNTFTFSQIIVSVFCVSQIDIQDYKVLISLSSVVLFAAFQHPFYLRLYSVWRCHWAIEIIGFQI